MALARASGSIRSHGPVGGSGSSKNAKVSCTQALLHGGSRHLIPQREKAIEESVHDGARLQQLGERAENAGHDDGQLLTGRQIGPLNRDERTATVGKNHQQARAVAMHLPHDLQGHAFEGVTLADHRYPTWKLAEMGSVSPVPSTRSAGNGWSGSWNTGSRTGGSCA